MALLAVLPALLVAVGLPAFAPSAFADTPVVNSTIDNPAPAPCDTVTMSITFTNTQATDVNFVYLSINTSYPTETVPGLQWTITSCTGDVSWCPGGAMHFTAPIPPGASRTAVVTYQVASTSACGEADGIGFFFYYYDEFTDASGNFASTDGEAGSPVAYVTCT